MNGFSKFVGCNKIVCIKSAFGFEAGKIYNCKVSYVQNVILIKIEIYDDYKSFYGIGRFIDMILETFITLSEHRKIVIEELL